jgi:hypothetical protein
MHKKKPIGYSKKDTSEMKALIERTEPKSGDYVGSGTVTTVPKKKKKMKRMMDGGMANAMMQRGTQPNERGPIKGAPDYTTMPIRGPGGKGSESPGMPKTGGMTRDARMTKRIQEKFGKMSSRFPGYKPELASPVDTRDELKSYRMGLRDYRKANPGINPVRGPGGRIRGGGGVPVQGPGGVVVPPLRDSTTGLPAAIAQRRSVPPMRPDGKGSESPGMPKKLDFGRGTNIQIGGGGRTPGIRGVSDAPGRINPDYARNRAGIPSIAQIESKPISGMRPDPVTGRLPTPVPKVDMTAPRQPGQKGYGMKGGGLARKGVGMALAKGGLVKANGCAKRGKTKGRMV